jgi:hypothetical protein
MKRKFARQRKTAIICAVWASFIFLLAASRIPDSPGNLPGVIDIGSRLELFVDDFLIDQMDGPNLLLHPPVPREVAIVFDKPWEGNTSGYVTVFQDGNVYRMYYRGSNYDAKAKTYGPQVVCYAESRDGIRWLKPDLGLVEFNGSKKNNILWTGLGTHNFTPLLDSRPGCPPEEKYKALASDEKNENLFAFKSADGLHWSFLKKEPVIPKGTFDSQNLAFWDSVRGTYLEFNRGWRSDTRDIMISRSADFRTWTEPQWLNWGTAPIEHLYTNAVTPYFRAPHILIGFPKRFVPDRKIGTHEIPGVSDGLFMSSRDGLHWKRWGQAFLRPGLQKERWVNRNNMIAWGILVTKPDSPELPDELSLFSSEGYYVENCRMRRHTLRLDGFVSVNADFRGGQLVTRPLIFQGGRLILNFSTSAAGSIRVEIQDEDRHPIRGFELAACEEIFGDEIDRPVRWKAGPSLDRLSGRPVRLRFVMRDADLYSLCFK